MSDRQEQPGQVSPSGELQEVRDRLCTWMDQHSSGPPWNPAMHLVDEAQCNLADAIKILKESTNAD